MGAAQHRLQRTAALPFASRRVFPEMAREPQRSLASPAAAAEPFRWASRTES